MNCLNSVLIEGEASGTQDIGGGLVGFEILVKRGGDEFPFQVQAAGRIAQSCASKLPRGLRIVGRLENIAGAVTIIAEHVEFKPVQKLAQSVNHSANSGADYMGDHGPGL